jgi:two-component system response regulator
MVIVCDDDHDDWLLIQDAWAHVAPTVELRYAKDGQALLDLLTTMATEDDTFPALVILDLNMPVLNGWDTLAAIKTSNELAHIPTIILTTSSNHGDRCLAIGIHAAGYFTKPPTYRELVEMTASFNTCWITTTHP